MHNFSVWNPHKHTHTHTHISQPHTDYRVSLLHYRHLIMFYFQVPMPSKTEKKKRPQTDLYYHVPGKNHPASCTMGTGSFPGGGGRGGQGVGLTPPLIMEKLQKDLDRLGEWAVENAMKINPHKSKAIRFTRARIKGPLNYSLMGTLIPEASSCKYLGIILRSNFSWADQVNYVVKKAWKALHFKMWIVKKGNSNTKSLAYMSLVRPILEYGAACWDPYREGQMSASDRVQKKAAKLHIIRTVQTGKLWCRVESYHAYVPSSKRTLGNARGSLLVTD